MGCSNYEFPDYESNQKEDYLTKTIFESILARKRAKIQDAYDAERKEQEDQEKELMRQQYLLNSIDPKGPKSYIDNLINKEIPKMKFGNLASEEEIINDLNDRVCEEYGEDEKEEEDVEEMSEGEIKEKQEKNKNEMEELKRQLEELNKKSEEEKNKKRNKTKKINKDGFFGKKKDNKENEEQKDEKENEEEEENSELKENNVNNKKKEKNEKSNEDEEEEDDGIISQLNKKDMKNKMDGENKNKNENKKRNQKFNENNNEEDEEDEEGEEQEDNFEDGENNKINNKNKLKKNNKKINKNKNEIENEEEFEINNEENEDLESEESKKILKKKKLEQKRIKRQIKMKELMKLKAENPSYKDKIKKYKYPKKEIEEKQKADFPPSPSEIVICVIGEEKNGKTSFIKKYTRNVFEQTYKKTETIDTYDEAEGEYESKKIKLTIIDTPPLNDRKKTNLIQDKGINKSHAIIYIVDINDEYADFKVKLTMQNFEFSDKQIIAILGNKSDKVSIFSKKNKDTLGGFCSLKKFFFEILSCQDTPQNEIENFVNEKIINEYFKLYNA